MILLMKKLDKPVNFKEIVELYEPNLSQIFFKEDEVEILKLIIKERLDVIDRNILLMYLSKDLSVKETAKFYSCSKTLLRTKLNSIKEKVKEEFVKYTGKNR